MGRRPLRRRGCAAGARTLDSFVYRDKHHREQTTVRVPPMSRVNTGAGDDA
jgi:hypothetical protein